MGTTSSRDIGKTKTEMEKRTTGTKKKMEAEKIMVEGVPFPQEIFTPNALSLVAQGVSDYPKKAVIGVYLDTSDVIAHKENWKMRNRDVLGHDNLLDALLFAAGEKFIRVVVTEEETDDLYVENLDMKLKVFLDESTIAEKTELDKVVKFFRSKQFKTNTIITYYFSAKDGTCKIGIEVEGKEEYLTVENVRLVKVLHILGLTGVNRVLPGFDN